MKRPSVTIPLPPSVHELAGKPACCAYDHPATRRFHASTWWYLSFFESIPFVGHHLPGVSCPGPPSRPYGSEQERSSAEMSSRITLDLKGVLLMADNGNVHLSCTHLKKAENYPRRIRSRLVLLRSHTQMDNVEYSDPSMPLKIRPAEMEQSKFSTSPGRPQRYRSIQCRLNDMWRSVAAAADEADADEADWA